MCGRYLLISPLERLVEHFDVDEVRTEALPERYNVAPTTSVYAVIEDDESRRLGTMRWGFIAPWADRSRRGPEPINARSETAGDSKLFGPSVARKRCILPADGFYEWRADEAGGRKQPFHIAAEDGAPLAFAAVFSTWRDRAEPDAAPVTSAAILTRAAAGPAAEIHERMPVVVPPARWRDWLTDDEHAGELLGELAESEPVALTTTPISDRVNNVRNDGPELLTPVAA